MRFATINRLPGYRFGDDGTVWTCRRTHGFSNSWRQMRTTPSAGGYMKVQLVGSDGKQRNLYVHRLVLEAFVGECPEGMECCHGNGMRTDNRASNLRWDARKANHADRCEHGNGLNGSTNGMSALTEPQVIAMREIYRRGSANKTRLAAWFGVSVSSAGRAISRTTWSHI